MRGTKDLRREKSLSLDATPLHELFRPVRNRYEELTGVEDVMRTQSCIIGSPSMVHPVRGVISHCERRAQSCVAAACSPCGKRLGEVAEIATERASFWSQRLCIELADATVGADDKGAGDELRHSSPDRSGKPRGKAAKSGKTKGKASKRARRKAGTFRSIVKFTTNFGAECRMLDERRRLIEPRSPH
jgi:hypothetical protein